MILFLFKKLIILLAVVFPVYKSHSVLETGLKEEGGKAVKLPAQKAGNVSRFLQTKQKNQTSPTIGLILAFTSWPEGKEKEALLKQLQEAGLKKKAEHKAFKTWVFEWPDWRKAEEAEQICKKISKLSVLDYCEPDSLLEPATGKLRKRAKKKVHKELINREGPARQPKGGPNLNPPSIPSDIQGGNVRSCNIVSSQLNLGSIGDYWAQERVGSDLLKEELKKAPPVKKHLVAVFDTPYKNRHDMGVRNIISGSGPQAVLPPLGNNMTYSDVTISSHYLDHSSHLLKTADKICTDKKSM